MEFNVGARFCRPAVVICPSQDWCQRIGKPHFMLEEMYGVMEYKWTLKGMFPIYSFSLAVTWELTVDCEMEIVCFSFKLPM